MSGIAPGADPSMDDILASIRRILNEDTEAASAAAAAGPAAAPAFAHGSSAHDPGPIDDDEELLLDHTMLIEASAAEPASVEPALVEPSSVEPQPVEPGIFVRPALAPLPVTVETAPVPILHPATVVEAPLMQDVPFQPVPSPPSSMPASAASPDAAENPPAPASDVSSGLLGATASQVATSSMMSLVRAVAAERTSTVNRGGPSIEDVVREELRPLLKEWLDTHLPPIVERLVRAEIERVVGRVAF